MKKVVVIGGGTGVFSVLTGLKKYPFHLTAIVSIADDGGSTGKLRDEFGILPPGDIRRALVALAGDDSIMMSEVFNFRFGEKSSLKGHSLGNLLLTALEKITGNFDEAVKEAGRILRINGEVIPVSLESTRLCAELENGEIVRGETNIDIPKHNADLRIKKIFLAPKVNANSDALRAIKEADVVILGPGDVYTSILPNIVVGGIKNAIKKTSAEIVYITNVMTKYGETHGFAASDFIQEIEKYLGQDVINRVVINTEKPKGKAFARYVKEKEELVRYDAKNINKKVKITKGDFLRKGHFVRHDPEKLAHALARIINSE